MKNSIRALAIAACLGGVPAMAGHVEGEETNVVIVVCAVDTASTPSTIKVQAVSTNATSAFVPPTTVGKPCAEALHALLTAGFDIAHEELTQQMFFVLTRQDPVAQSGG